MTDIADMEVELDDGDGDCDTVKLDNIQSQSQDILHHHHHDIVTMTTLHHDNLQEMEVSVGGADMPPLDADFSIADHQVLETIELDASDIMNATEMDDGDQTMLPEILKSDTPMVTQVAVPAVTSVQAAKVTNNVNVTKPISIAPKPVGIVTGNVVKKISLANVATKGATIGQDLQGKQIVFLPTNNRIKFVNTNQTAQLIKSSSGQVIQLKQSSPSKLTVAGNSPTLTIPKGAATHLINMQQSQPQFKLLTTNKMLTNKVVSMPSKQGILSNINASIRPVRQMLTTLKSPTKILPAPTLGANNTTKLLTTVNTPGAVLRPALNKGQIFKVDRGSVVAGNTLLAGVPSPKVNTQQIHQINIPGKGIQYVRLVPTPNISQNNQSRIIMPSSPLKMTPVPITAASTSGATPKTTAAPTKTTQILPKTFILTEFPNNIVQMQGANKGQNIVMTSLPTAVKKAVVGKPQGKLIAVPVKLDNQQTQKPNQQSGSVPVNNVQIADKSEKSEAAPPKRGGYVKTELIDPEIVNKVMSSSVLDIKQEYPDSYKSDNSIECVIRTRKACNCTKSQCLKLYCDCFANGEFCHNCNCHNCYNNIENEEYRQKAIRSCLDRNPDAFRPKIGKAKNSGIDSTRRHNKGCNCKRSGCLKNYCECFEGKISCSANCKCVGCRNVEDSFDKQLIRKTREATMTATSITDTFNNNNNTNSSSYAKSHQDHHIQTNIKQLSKVVNANVIDAICQCLLVQAVDSETLEEISGASATQNILEEFACCLQDIINFKVVDKDKKTSA